MRPIQQIGVNSRTVIDSSDSRRDVFVAILTATFIAFASIVASNIFGLFALPFRDVGLSQIGLVLISFTLGGIGLMTPAIVYVYYRTEGSLTDFSEYVYLRKPTLQVVKPILYGFFALTGLYIALVILFTTLGIDIGDNQSVTVVEENPSLLPAIAFGAVIVAPITEEFVFRGVVQRRLHEHLAPVFAIGGACLIFGFFHIPVVSGDVEARIGYALFLAITSTVYSYLYYKFENLFIPIVIHSVYNASILYLLFLSL